MMDGDKHCLRMPTRTLQHGAQQKPSTKPTHYQDQPSVIIFKKKKKSDKKTTK